MPLIEFLRRGLKQHFGGLSDDPEKFQFTTYKKALSKQEWQKLYNVLLEPTLDNAFIGVCQIFNTAGLINAILYLILCDS